MAKMKTPILVAAFFLLLSCGGTSNSESSIEPEPRNRSDIDLSGRDALEFVLSGAAKASSVRTSVWIGQEISAPLLGLQSSTSIDPRNPSIISESSPEASHASIDLSSILGPMAEEVPDLKMEIWSDDEVIVIDTRSFGAVTALNPSAELGPMRPGLASIDFDASGVRSETLVKALVGTSIPNPSDLAQRLLQILTITEAGDQASDGYRGVASFADYQSAFGQDLESLARGAASGVALGLGIDLDELSALYEEFYRSLDVELLIEVDEDGVLAGLTVNTDLSQIWSYIFDASNANLFGVAPSDLESISAQAAESTWTTQTIISFSFEEGLAVEPVPIANEDRTNEWVDFLETSGLL